MKKPMIAALALCIAAGPALAGPGHDGKHRGPEHFIQKVDTDKDGKVSRAEFQAKGDKMFGEADSNNDGFITADEAKAAHEARKAKWQAHKAEVMKNNEAGK